jgi:hypothetical protein
VSSVESCLAEKKSSSRLEPVGGAFASALSQEEVAADQAGTGTSLNLSITLRVDLRRNSSMQSALAQISALMRHSLPPRAEFSGGRLKGARSLAGLQ